MTPLSQNAWRRHRLSLIGIQAASLFRPQFGGDELTEVAGQQPRLFFRPALRLAGEPPHDDDHVGQQPHRLLAIDLVDRCPVAFTEPAGRRKRPPLVPLSNEQLLADLLLIERFLDGFRLFLVKNTALLSNQPAAVFQPLFASLRCEQTEIPNPLAVQRQDVRRETYYKLFAAHRLGGAAFGPVILHLDRHLLAIILHQTPVADRGPGDTRG